MNTSQTYTLSKPAGSDLIPLGTLGYFRSRNRWRAYEVVLDRFRKSGLTKADLARRLGKRPEVVSRLLGAPGNWGLDTLSDLLFAISGAEVDYDVGYPLDGAPRNHTAPDWIQTTAATSGSSSIVTVGNAGAAVFASSSFSVVPVVGTP